MSDERQASGLGFHPVGLRAGWRMAWRGPGGTQEDTPIPSPAPVPYAVAKTQGREDNELGCRGATGIQEIGRLPVEWIAEAEEAGLGHEVAGARLANGCGLSGAPPAGRGPGGRAGGARCERARVPALPHPSRAPAPAASPPLSSRPCSRSAASRLGLAGPVGWVRGGGGDGGWLC